MDRIKAKLAVWAKDRRFVRAAVAIAAALLVLIICLCISIGMQSNIQHKHARAAEQMQEQVYQGLLRMSELFARVDDPAVDVQNKLIPELKAEYTGVTELNDALTSGFGARQAVLSPELKAAFDAAFEEYSTAYRQGLATELAQTDMTACIEQIQAMLDEHYSPKAEPTEPVVVIDGASGTIKK